MKQSSGSLDITVRGLVLLQLVNFILTFENLQMSLQYDLLFYRKLSWKTRLAEFRKGLKVLNMVMIEIFAQKGGPSIYRGCIYYITLTVDTLVFVSYMLRPSNHCVFLWTIPLSANASRPLIDGLLSSSLRRSRRIAYTVVSPKYPESLSSSLRILSNVALESGSIVTPPAILVFCKIGRPSTPSFHRRVSTF